MSILQNLTEGIVNRDLSKEGEAILNKWEKTGLLEGITGDFNRNQMAVLLENQAKELLRESNTMKGGDVEGFAAVAFPIVRRVFGGLLAQKLVSVQPMSLPSGLVFFMDFVKQNDSDRTFQNGMGTNNPSVFGGQKVGSEILEGVELDPEKATTGTPQFQDLIHGHTSARGSAKATGVVAAGTTFDVGGTAVVGDDNALLIDFDADILATVDAAKVTVMEVKCPATLGAAPNIAANGQIAQLADGDLRHLHCDGGLVRRLTKDLGTVGTDRIIKLVFIEAGANAGKADAAADNELTLEFAITDNLVQGNVLGSVKGALSWELEENGDLPEISIRVDSSAITAMTRKLKASWTPELAQDLNAYHNLDAEVELTGILSEQIALEIDQEILSDLIAGAQASKLYWSRRPGLFVNRLTGQDATSLASPPDFTGSVSEWYETLVETINDVSADIHRKTLRGGANFLVCGPEVANILEFTSGFRASVTHDDATGSVGAVQIGSINKKWDLHVDPYFPRNAILVGRKGASFLESGYVYAPYVPLQVTPTIFDTADFTPRKAVMTRYGKKMVRPDMYGLVICRDLEG
tara:strand:- start:2786 stop:4522 length:1737 start_codon:yes stop_codon:yes gene_type:complete